MEPLKAKINTLFHSDTIWGKIVLTTAIYLLYCFIFYTIPLSFVTEFNLLKVAAGIFTFILFVLWLGVENTISGILSEYGAYLNNHPNLEFFWFFFLLAPILIIVPFLLTHWLLPKFPRKFFYLIILSLIVIVILTVYSYVFLVGSALEQGFSF